MLTIVWMPTFTNAWRHMVVKVLIYIEMLFIFPIPVLIRHLWQLKAVVFLHRCLICVLLFTKGDSSSKGSIHQKVTILQNVSLPKAAILQNMTVCQWWQFVKMWLLVKCDMTVRQTWHDLLKVTIRQKREGRRSDGNLKPSISQNTTY